MRTAVKVTLSEQDIRNAEELTKYFNMGSMEATVNAALSLTNQFMEVMQIDGPLFVRRQDGSLEESVLIRSSTRKLGASTPC